VTCTSSIAAIPLSQLHLDQVLESFSINRYQQRWPAKFGQPDKWRTCLRAAMMPPLIRRSGRKPVEGFEHFAEHRQQALDAATGRRTE
jgi:hypothetical protein